MAELKTKVTNASPAAFIREVKDAQMRKDALELLKIFREATHEKPRMWGTSIIGFGSYSYASQRSSQKGDWMLTGFLPRKRDLTVYIMPGFKAYGGILEKLGTHRKSGGSCLYIRRLSDIDAKTLAKLIKASVADIKKKYK